MIWTDYPTYYREHHRDALRDLRNVGRRGASIFFADHGGGHIHIPETDDLLIVWATHIPGRATLDYGGNKVNMRDCSGHEFMVCPPKTSLDVFVEKPHQTTTLAIPYPTIVEAADLGDRLPRDGNFGDLHAELQTDISMIRLLTQLWKETHHVTPWTALSAEGLLLQITSSLMRLSDHNGPQKRGKLANWQLKRITEYANSRLDEDVTLTDLAELCNLSPQYFCNAFSKTVGQPPHHWLRKLRMDEAKSLLADPRMKIMDVALSVGFQSHGSFATAFRKVTGMTPSNYRTLIR